MGNTIGYQYDELVAEKSERLHILDANHSFQWIHGGDAHKIVGIIEYHRTPTGEACGGFVNFEKESDRPCWEVEAFDPLTISPSVLCKGGYGSCTGDHGFIKGGKWVAA